MVSKVQSYYKYNYREQLDFRYRLYLLSKEKDFAKRLDIVDQLTWKALTRGIGYYTCYELEKPFLELADKIKMPIGIQATSNSFLHVMTQAYTVGGHTRVVERWIDSSPREQKHSVVLLNQKEKPFPITLNDCVSEHNGSLHIYDSLDLLERATKLRKLALEYQYIILHIHMDDPTAIVAFGNDSFPRPVLFFNHADHSYWCGSSIVDMLLDIRDNDFAKKRCIKNHYTIRIPLPLDINGWDRAVFIANSFKGGIYYIAEPLAVYRKNDDGISTWVTVDRMKKDLNMIKWFKSFNKKFPAHLYLSHLHYTIFHYAHNVPTKLVIKHYLLHLYYALLSFPQSKYKIKEAQRAFKIVMKPRITQTKLYRLLKNN